jgi:hypothetical protein
MKQLQFMSGADAVLALAKVAFGQRRAMSFLQRLGGQLSKWQRAIANMGDLAPPGNEFLLKLGAEHLQWELADDRLFGGLSEGAVSLGAEESVQFSGVTSLKLDARAKQIKNDKGKVVTRTGWCAMQADVLDEGWELEDADGLRLRVRHSGERSFFLNLRSEGMLGEERVDLYQAEIPTPLKPMEWRARRPVG